MSPGCRLAAETPSMLAALRAPHDREQSAAPREPRLSGSIRQLRAPSAAHAQQEAGRRGPKTGGPQSAERGARGRNRAAREPLRRVRRRSLKHPKTASLAATGLRGIWAESGRELQRLRRRIQPFDSARVRIMAFRRPHAILGIGVPDLPPSASSGPFEITKRRTREPSRRRPFVACNGPTLACDPKSLRHRAAPASVVAPLMRSRSFTSGLAGSKPPESRATAARAQQVDGATGRWQQVDSTPRTPRCSLMKAVICATGGRAPRTEFGWLPRGESRTCQTPAPNLFSNSATTWV